ncbi:MAG: hypothetical protein WC841_04805 [Candidatus Shapirobacteria bacterium]|jgi:hypothetical protein
MAERKGLPLSHQDRSVLLVVRHTAQVANIPLSEEVEQAFLQVRQAQYAELRATKGLSGGDISDQDLLLRCVRENP